MPEPGAQFLHERNNNLHATPDVEHVVDYLRAGGDAIPNQPADKITAYLGFLADREYVNNGILTGDQASINRQVEAHVIKPQDVPEGYFALHRRIAREQGHGDIAISDGIRHQMTEAIQADQRAGLGNWVEYLGGEAYPDWFKLYAFDSVTKLGNFDKEKGEFLKRSTGTTAAYPDLNREALAYVYDKIEKTRVSGDAKSQKENLKQEPEELQKLLQSANFGKLYAHAVLETKPMDPEIRKDIRGSWTKFDQTRDPRIARKLSGSLQGYGTGWCTAGDSFAQRQLQGGDFYVYYTRDQEGNNVVPRVAIRMESGEVTEVRGINPQQELESDMADVTLEQLKDLPGGDKYLQKAEDMKRLTALENKITANPQTELTRDEMTFLFEFDHEINGFGYIKDPRVAQLRQTRGVAEKDYPLLVSLLAESLPNQVETSQAAYMVVTKQLNNLRDQNNPVEYADQAEFIEVLNAKINEWKDNGLLEKCIAQIVANGGRIILVASPNVLVEPDEIIGLAQNFGENQPIKTRTDDGLIKSYSKEELSGETIPDSKVKLSLIPSGLDPSLRLKRKQRSVLTSANKPNNAKLKVPSVLEALSYWHTLRAMGDKLADRQAFDRTLIHHFDLDPHENRFWNEIPASYIDDYGMPHLSHTRNEDYNKGSHLAAR